MRLQIFKLFWILLIVPTMALAQPPEELPAEDASQAEEGFESVEPVPVAEPAPAPIPEPAASPDDDTVRGVTLSPSLGVYPLGYDSINLSADNSEGKRYFLQLQPSLALDSLFKTAGGRKMGFSLAYTLIYREYFNKGTTFRDIENDLEGSFSIDWTDRLSMSMYALAGYMFKVGEDTNEDNAIFLDITAPKFTFKANDQISFGLGFWAQWAEILNSYLSANEADYPGDLDDIRRGDITSAASGYLDFSSPYYDSYLGDLTSDERYWAGNLGVRANVGWTPIDGTSVKMDYRYVFEGLSNKSAAQWRGHYIKPSVSQAMPWPGGRVSLANELRLRIYESSFVEGTSAKVQKFRNRLTLSVSQAINDFMSFKGFYRWQITGKNADDYSNTPQAHWFFMGVDLSF